MQRNVSLLHIFGCKSFVFGGWLGIEIAVWIIAAFFG